jgi:hypothetical protein
LKGVKIKKQSKIYCQKSDVKHLRPADLRATAKISYNYYFYEILSGFIYGEKQWQVGFS